MEYTITIAKSDRGNYHISKGENLKTLCPSRAVQRETYTKPAGIRVTRREFDSIPWPYRCEKCMEKAWVLSRKGS